MIGLFNGHGPFIMDLYQYFIKRNPESWVKRANVLYLDHPVGVGYSYTTDMTEYMQNDMSSSLYSFKAIQKFFEYFPEYLKNPIYTSGNSYGGIYAPYLAWRIHDWNQKAKLFESSENPIVTYNLAGFVVTDTAINWDIDGPQTIFEVMYNFNMIPYELYNQYTNENKCVRYFRDLINPPSSICLQLFNKMTQLTFGFTSGWNDVFMKESEQMKYYTDSGYLDISFSEQCNTTDDLNDERQYGFRQSELFRLQFGSQHSALKEGTKYS